MAFDEAWKACLGPDDADFMAAVRSRGELFAAWRHQSAGAADRLTVLYVGWTAGRACAFEVPKTRERTVSEKVELHQRFREMASEGVAPEAICSRLGTTMGEMVEVEVSLFGQEETVRPRAISIGDRLLILGRWWKVERVRTEGSEVHVHAKDWRGQVLDHRYVGGTEAIRWKVGAS